MRPIILVVDDDPAIREGLRRALGDAGYQVDQAADGDEALAAWSHRRPDLLLTDLAMPRRDGYGLITAVRRTSPIPIVVLSVRGGEDDKVRALDLGADDYVQKPFSVRELLARVRSQLRRPQPQPESPMRLVFPDLVIDRERREVRQGGRLVKLTPSELGILEVLALFAGRPVSIAKIVDHVWRGDRTTSPDTVRVHVGTLRRKLEPDPARPRYIVTEPWVGYRFLPEPVAPEPATA